MQVTKCVTAHSRCRHKRHDKKTPSFRNRPRGRTLNHILRENTLNNIMYFGCRRKRHDDKTPNLRKGIKSRILDLFGVNIPMTGIV